MKGIIRSAAASVLSLVAASGAAHAAPLTRAVNVVEGTETHQYLGTEFGQTLYTFDLDANGHSACAQACAEKWPPLLVAADEATALAAPYGTITRASGVLQVTYQSKPLYTYYLDHVEGDDKGDSVGNVWHDIDFQ